MIRGTERKKMNKNPLPLCSSCSTMEKLAIYKKEKQYVRKWKVLQENIRQERGKEVPEQR